MPVARLISGASWREGALFIFNSCWESSNACRADGEPRSGAVRRRTAELAFLERCLEDGALASVILIHGRGGIGKSTLLRELARRAAAHGS